MCACMCASGSRKVPVWMLCAHIPILICPGHADSLNAWSSKFIDGSLTSCYTGAQPIAAALASLAVIHSTEPPHHGLQPPQRAHVIGTAAILAGLWLVVRSSRDAAALDRGDGTDARKKIT